VQEVSRMVEAGPAAVGKATDQMGTGTRKGGGRRKKSR